MDNLQKLGSLRDGVTKEVLSQLTLSLNSIFPRKRETDDFNLLDLEEKPRTPVVLTEEQAHRITTLCGQQYIYDNEYAAGGEGLVLRVRNSWTGRREVLKLANNIIRDKKKSTARFLRGAKIQSFAKSKLLFGVPETYTINWDLIYYSMEYIAGETLLNFLAKCIDEKLLMSLFIKVLDLIAEVHRRKLIHRDIKPQNFKVVKHPITGQFEPVLLDWNLAKNIENPSEGLTGIGTELGTPAYVSDEQWEDAANATYADDIFACGRLLYVFLTYKQLGKLPQNKKDYFPDKYLPSRWIKIYTMSCEVKDARYPTATAMSNAIRRELGMPLVSERPQDSNVEELPQQVVTVKPIEVKHEVIEALPDDTSKIVVDLNKIPDEAVRKFMIASEAFRKIKLKKSE